MSDDFIVRLEAAKNAMPLSRLMQQYGKLPGGIPQGKFVCPYCGDKSSASLRKSRRGGGEIFKCFKDSCPSATAGEKKSWDEVGFLMHELGKPWREAAIEFLKMTGNWRERESHAPSVMPGKAARKIRNPEPPKKIPHEDDPVGAEEEAPRPPEEQPAPGEVPPGDVPEPTPSPLPDPEGAPLPADEVIQEAGHDGGMSATAGDAPPEPDTPVIEPPQLPPEPPPKDRHDPFKPLRYFYSKLILTDEDKDVLWKKRAILPETAELVGLKSSVRSNEDLLISMEGMFPTAELLGCGLYLEKNGRAVPNSQFYGWGITGKKDADKNFVWDWVYPILIPYFNPAGEVIHLRPHRGMSKEKAPMLYVVRQAGKPIKETDADLLRTAMITEGEFKAIAFWQATGQMRDKADQLAVGSLPGITMAKILQADIEEWLAIEGARAVVVAFDNEDKSTPGLPGYKDKVWKRVDAKGWALFLAQVLAKNGYDAKIGNIPDQWRDANGKADWDGALEKLVREFHGGAVPVMESKPVWTRCAPRVDRMFRKVLQDAVPAYELTQPGLFETEELRAIRNLLARLSRVPMLLQGGSETKSIAGKLQRLVKKLTHDRGRIGSDKMKWAMLNVAREYRELDGRYYILKPLSDKAIAAWAVELHNAGERDDVEMKRACEVMLKGKPTFITDFVIEPKYHLRKSNGKSIRLISIISVHCDPGTGQPKESGLVELDSESFAQPSKFRTWLLEVGGFAWKAGERELNDLQFDMNTSLAFKEVTEVPIRGYHSDTKLWFYGDVAMADSVGEILPDEDKIFWYEGLGYKLGTRDQEGQEFCQKDPELHPKMNAKDHLPHVDGVDPVVNLFEEASIKMFETLGSEEGFLAIGMFLSYPAAPEIFRRFSGFPGLWLHGATGHGKSSVARWGLRFSGFSHIEKGVPLPDTSEVGASIAGQQYSNVPIWLEEFQPNSRPGMIEKLKNFYGRESGLKKRVDMDNRKILTAPIVSGIATSTDAQLKNRYVHIHVARQKRQADHFWWFEENSPKFFFVGRAIMRDRAKYAKLVLENLKEWFEDPLLASTDSRVKTAYGVGYAAFCAACQLFDSRLKGALPKLKQWMLKNVAEAVIEVKRQVNINAFWNDVLEALQAGALGETTTDLLRIFAYRETKAAHPPTIGENDASQQTQYAWKTTRIYFKPDLLIGLLRAYKRKSGKDLELDRGDLRSQMKTLSYWGGDEKTMRFMGIGGQMNRTAERCWCINLDFHELGYVYVLDEEFRKSLFTEGDEAQQRWLPQTDWLDPRRGDLFALIDAIERGMSKVNNHDSSGEK